MGDVNERKQQVDWEQDPQVIEKRNKLFNLYIPPYYNMIYKLCIQYSFKPENVEENYNEVLVNFYRRIHTYNPKRPLLTWIHICTKRLVFSLEKKREKRACHYTKHVNVEKCRGGRTHNNDNAGQNFFGVDTYKEHLSDDVLTVLEELNPIYRDALILHEAGYSLKEIIEIEHNKGTLKSKNMETIKGRLFLARQYLKKHLTRDGKRIQNSTNQEDTDADN